MDSQFRPTVGNVYRFELASSCADCRRVGPIKALLHKLSFHQGQVNSKLGKFAFELVWHDVEFKSTNWSIFSSVFIGLIYLL